MDHLDAVNPFRTLVARSRDRILVDNALTPTPEELAGVAPILSRPTPLYVEIGSGSGGHLIQRAYEDPESIYIGFELRYKRAYRTIEKSLERNISNTYILRTNAKHLGLIFPPSSISGVYVNFPDPWEKRHWLKNRILSPEFLSTIATVLKPGGFLSYKTDHPEYFARTVSLLEESPQFVQAAHTTNLHQSEWNADNVLTEFEKLFTSQGLLINFVRYLKQG
jgi:tRNA (guanine-N7-)-methyltransferase